MPGAIVRQIDELGRVVIPAEIRRMFGIEDGTPIEIFLDDERVVLRVYRAGCVFCGTVEDTREYSGRPVCRACSAGTGSLFDARPGANRAERHEQRTVTS